MIGHPSQQHENFNSVISFWQMMVNHELTDMEDRKAAG
jgi:hypothetical protein